jgi:hypothetical protein
MATCGVPDIALIARRETGVNALVQIGFEKEPDLPGVPLVQDVVRTPDGLDILRVVNLPTALGLAHWVAPGVPADRLEALRAAYTATMRAGEFVNEAARLSMQLRPQTGAQVMALTARVNDTPKAVLEKTAKVLGWWLCRSLEVFFSVPGRLHTVLVIRCLTYSCKFDALKSNF